MDDKNLLEELSDRAFKIYLENPDNDYARHIMLESNKLFLSVQEEKKNNGKTKDEDDEDNEESNQNDSEEDGNEKNEPELIDLFGDDEVAFDISYKEVVDPLFGLKAGLCFDSVTEFEMAIIKQIGEDENLNLLMGANMYEKYVTTNSKQKKYKDVERDYEKASIETAGGKRLPLAFDLASNPEKQHFVINYIRSNTNKNNKVFISHKDYGMEKYISYDLGKSEIYPVGAGQLEFLARMVYTATGGQYPGIASSILVSGDRTAAQNREQALFELAPKTIGYNCLRILRQYLTKAAKQILQPIIQKRHFHDFIPSGVDAVINGIRKGQYTFENANLASWAFEVIKNESIDLLKPITNYKLDVDKAYKYISEQDKIQFYSKANPDEAKAMREKIRKVTDNPQASFSEVDSERFKTIKNSKYFLYKYDNMNSFFEDIKRANGFYSDAEEGYLRTVDPASKKSQGAPIKNIKQSPVYFGNVRKDFKEKFMTSVPKSILMQPGDIETSSDVIQAKEELPREIKAREKAAEKLSLAMVGELRKIVDDIYLKIIEAPAKQNMYGHKSVVSYMKDNPRLTKDLMLALLNYGVYKFQKNNWKWYTAPQKYADEFLKDIEDSGFTGQDMPKFVRNNDGTTLPMYDSSSPVSFLNEIKRILIGTKYLGSNLANLALRGDRESDEMYKQLASQGPGGTPKASVPFLLREPSYLRRIYETMQKIHSDAVVGRENIRAEKPYDYVPPTTDRELGIRNVNESTEKIKTLIKMMRKKINSEKNNINLNFLNSWK